MEKRGQVWVETVIYTLIGLTIIGILISVSLPKINQISDKAVISQTINSLNDIDSQIGKILIAAGNKREINLMIKKGEYTINSLDNEIYYVLKGTNLLYSEVNQTGKQGDLEIITRQRNGKYDVYLYLKYDNLNLIYEGKEINKTLTEAPTSYKLLIENNGKVGGTTQINMKLV